VHQCARFRADPKTENSKAIKAIGRYLAGKKYQCLIFTINDEGLECSSDADFSGNWKKDIAMDDDSTTRSHTGFIIRYAGCPLIWQSMLQTEIALRSTESEYIALSESLREVIYIIDLLKEMDKTGFKFNTNTTQVK
jgi:hypothetical protein